MYINILNKFKDLEISVFNKLGNVELKHFTLPDIYTWEKTNFGDPNRNTDYTAIDGSHVKRVKSKRITKFLLAEFFKSLPKEEHDYIFSTLMPNIYFCDIETEVNEFSKRNIKLYIEEAINKVNSISLLTPDNEVVVFSTKPLENLHLLEDRVNGYLDGVTTTKFKITYRLYKDEFSMLQSFFAEYVINIPLLTGWNFEDFDWAYLVNRALNIGVDIKLSSPAYEMDANNNNNPIHRAVMDYLKFYKKWDRKVKIKENFSLDFTAKAVLGITKIKYDGKLEDLYKNDFFTYIFYNIIDTILVKLIHDKLKTITIPLTLSAICKIPIYKNDSAVNITESLIFDEMLNRNIVLTKDYSEKENIDRLYILNTESFEQLKKVVDKQTLIKLTEIKDLIFTNSVDFLYNVELLIGNKKLYDKYISNILDETASKYQGAFVKEPIKGRHKYVACFDFASLYPTTMRQFDISVENFIDKFDIKTVKQLRETSKKEGTIVCANGVMFKKSESMLKSILSDLYSKRKTEKKKMFEYELKLTELKNELKNLNKQLESID